MSPRVSVIAPTWKHGAHVEECVGSILHGQKFKDFELVMVMDGRMQQHEQTLHFLKKNAGNPRLVQLWHEANRGQAEAINTGMEHAHGTDYLTWVHIDNWFHPSWLSKLVAFLDERQDVDFAWSWCVKQRGIHSRGRWCVWEQCEMHEPSQSFLFRRSHGKKVGRQRGGYAHDYDWFLRSQEAGQWGEVQKVLMARRIHPGGVSQTQHHKDDSHIWKAEAEKRRGVKLP